MTRVEGPFGSAVKVDAPDHPNAAMCVAQWLLHLPGEGIGYDHFVLVVGSLESVPGMPEPTLHYPRAEFELLLAALDPDQHPDAADVSTMVPMEPVNFVHQFHGISRSDAAAMAETLARGCVDGRLPAETQAYVQLTDGTEKMMYVRQFLDLWKLTVNRMVEHVRTGGLHEQVN